MEVIDVSGAPSQLSIYETLDFCTSCGHQAELRISDERIRPVCPNCGHIFYFAPLVAVAAVISDSDGHILLVRRGENPGKGMWGLPGGYVESDETLGVAIEREISEETGLEVNMRTLIGVWSFFHDSKQLSGASIIYLAEMTGGSLRAGSDSTEVWWASRKELMDLSLAFESHIEAIASVLRRWGSL